MGKHVKSWVLYSLLSVFAFTSSGCFALVVGAAAGAGGYAWIKGEVQEELQHPLAKVHEAALKALKKMDLAVTYEKKDDLSGSIESRFADGDAIKITTKYLTRNSTQIFIRVGTFGNEERSRQILDTVKKYL